ncbi:MAG TPA: DUF5723 family protein, partial [Cytophagales bacterium]|nr:DUF5723 family protein [Cytophagales bacterium]
MSKKIYMLGLQLGLVWLLQSQSQLGLYNFNTIHQSSFLNVSNHGVHKFSLGLPVIGSIYIGAGNTGFSIPKDVIDSVAVSNGKVTYITKGDFVDGLKAKNMTYVTSSFDLISFRIKAKHSYYSFNVTDHQEFRFLYPKDLFGVLRDGNQRYIGQEIILNDFRVNSQYYREYAFGYQHEHVEQKWSYGFRVKLLQGIASLHTSKSTTSILTEESKVEGNDLTVKSDIVVNTSYSKDWEEMDKLNSGDITRLLLKDFSNLGMALDIGASHKINKRLTIAGSLNNLGFIRWKKNPHNYKFKGEAKFEGVKIDNINNTNGEDLNTETVLDSLAESFKFDTTYKSYTSSLVGSSTLTLNYELGRNTSINALVFANYYRGIRLSASIGIQQKLGHLFAVMAYWGAQYGKFDNLGLGIMLKPGPIQLYAICDNLTPYLKAIDGSE